MAGAPFTLTGPRGSSGGGRIQMSDFGKYAPKPVAPAPPPLTDQQKTNNLLGTINKASGVSQTVARPAQNIKANATPYQYFKGTIHAIPGVSQAADIVGGVAKEATNLVRPTVGAPDMPSNISKKTSKSNPSQYIKSTKAQTKATAQDVASENQTPRRYLGSAAQTGLNVATGGEAGSAEKLAGSVAGRILKGGTQGALYGGASTGIQAAEGDKVTPQSAIENTAMSAATLGAVHGLFGRTHPSTMDVATNHPSMDQVIADQNRQKIAQEATLLTRENGGATIDIAGHKPTEGYAFSPYPGAEHVIEGPVTTDHVNSFIQQNMDKLSQPHNHIGIWHDEETGRTYLDVSQVGPPTGDTIKMAKEAGQLAVFDLKNFKEIPTGLTQGAHDEAITGASLDGGQKPERVGAGDQGSSTAVPTETRSAEEAAAKPATEPKPAEVTQPKAPEGPLREVPSQTGGSVTLHSGIDPGVDKFLSQDVVPKIAGIAQGTKDVKENAQAIVSPASMGDEAKATGRIVAKYKATTANQVAMDSSRMKKIFKFFNGRGDKENIANRSAYERTGQFAQEPVEGYSRFFKQSTDATHQMNQETYGKNDLGYVENYIQRNFVFGKRADEEQAVRVLHNYQSTLAPSTSHLQSRTLQMPTDEALQVLKDRGIKAKLVDSNPEMARQRSVATAYQAQGFKQMGQDLKDQKLVTFVRTGERVPDGLVKLNDHAFSVMFPSESGLVKAGEYYAPEGVARILNNAVSKGLEGSAIYRGLRNIKNNFNLLQLGLSAFHAGTTTINASLNDLVGGMRDIGGLKLGKGVVKLGRGLTPTASIIRQTYLGSKAFKMFKEDNPASAKIMRESINPAGFRLRMDQMYRTTVSQNLRKALANGNFLGATLRVPGAIIEQSMRPIMEHLVPNAKLGGMLDRAQQIQERMAGKSDAEVAQALREASDSMDNIYGQLVYDNLFWNKTVKDLAMLSQRSVGWNLGTVREIGGGVLDLKKTARGKGISDRTLFAASLPMLVGMYGATYQYLMTGQGPSELKDYFFPKNGLTDKNGNPDRVSLPSYMKDVYSYATHPLSTVENKTSPLMSMAFQLANNKNYYGDLIRNPNDPIGTQLEQTAQYVLGNTLPFSVQQGAKVHKEGGSVPQVLQSSVGITEAPAAQRNPNFTNKVYNLLDQQSSRGPRTPEQVDIASKKTAARQQIQQGQGDQLTKDLVQQGVIAPSSQKKFETDSKENSVQRVFNSLSRPNQLKALQDASPEEIRSLGDLGGLISRSQKNLSSSRTSPKTKQAASQILKLLGR